FWAAKPGRDALEIEWRPPADGGVDTTKLLADFHQKAKSPGAIVADIGKVDTALASAKQKLEAEYEVPYLAHAPMEPLNCTVRIGPDGAEVWTGTQFQTMDQTVTAKIAGLKPEQVKIHTMFLGGGFGRRATPTSDFVSEAVQVAKAARLAVPIKVVWTREDDMRGGYYRPMWVHKLRVGVAKDGLPAAWQ